MTGRLATFADLNPTRTTRTARRTSRTRSPSQRLPNGDAIVADAAANSVVKITKSGQLSLVARLAPPSTIRRTTSRRTSARRFRPSRPRPWRPPSP